MDRIIDVHGKRGAYCTDIHFGKKNNSPTHNEDCINYLKWFKEQVEQDGSIDYIAFLGDWNENRTALNVSTLHYSYQGAAILNSINKPVLFSVGNHDLFHKHTREVYSTVPYREFTNFHIVSTPTVFPNIGDGTLVCPYMFHAEYDSLSQYANIPVWLGHFEFQGFIITGYSVVMEHGPNAKQFDAQRRIFSGHFHKRQTQGNVTYIGNTFPMDFGDANDFERGMAIYDHTADTLEFKNWSDCPKYVKAPLSKVLDGRVDIPSRTILKCVVDTDLNYEQSIAIKTSLIESLGLRDFAYEEISVDAEVLGTETSVDVTNTDMSTDNPATVDQLVLQMLGDINTPGINVDFLQQTYRKLSSK